MSDALGLTVTRIKNAMVARAGSAKRHLRQCLLLMRDLLTRASDELLLTKGAHVNLDPRDPVHDEDTAKAIGATVKLATHALDGRGLSDEELDGLCDAALGETNADERRDENRKGKL